VEVLAIFGPTGIGKTALAVALARRLRERDGRDAVAISSDALQLYQGLETLTGVASPAEQAELEHRLVSVLPVTATSSAGAFAQLAHREVDAALEAGRVPIVVGGTGLYLRAALTDLSLRPPPPPGLREALLQRADREGLAALHAELPEDVRARTDPRDRTRVVRAHELLAQGVEPHADGGELWTATTRRPTRLVALTADRDWLAMRIDARVEAMVAAGAREEVLAADAAGASATARKALGFEELLAGDVERMKVRTRRYAKRQLTWLRKLPGVEHVDVTGRDPADVAAGLLP
jgi:tRNA dimethylallyltransferase